MVMNRLHEKYNEKIAKEVAQELGLANVMEAPRLRKITVSAGIGNFRESREAVESFERELAMITGQKPSERKAKKSEAGFKVRKNDVIGYTVTLRGERMWAFLDKLINIVLPRVRDFGGLNLNSFDKNGNYSLGVVEHVIFPEINPNEVKGIRGLQVTFTISAQDSQHSKVLMEKLGVPFKKS